MITLTPSEEDYLETILRISQVGDHVGVTEVAKARNVTVPTARAAVAKLIKHGLVSQEYYGKIFLNPTGRQRAEQVYAAHKVLLRFLRDVLHVDKELAEQDACRMEHGLSKKALSRLVLFLEAVDNCSSSQHGCLDLFRETTT